LFSIYDWSHWDPRDLSRPVVRNKTHRQMPSRTLWGVWSGPWAQRKNETKL